MRIIAGLKRGKKLFTPEDMHIRPTADRAREALFSILFARLENGFNDLAVLDVFAGTGALGLEALSRGAKEAAFVDLDLRLAEKNIKLCGFEQVKLIKANATALPKSPKVYDLIFADAPYQKGLTEPTLQALLNGGYVGAKTLIVAETAREESLTVPPSLTLTDERIYGAAKFWFLTLNA